MNEELKPCPFCGGEASFTLTESRAGKWGFVKCGSCGATCNDDDVGDADWCVDVWNRRAPSASIADTAGAKPCDMGVGCDESGVCYAEANGEPDRCSKFGVSETPPYGLTERERFIWNLGYSSGKENA